jgi:hypothetical protein
LWTLFIWLRIGTGGGILWTRKWTFGFHKRRGISWSAERTSSFCFMELYSKLPHISVGCLYHPQPEDAPTIPVAFNLFGNVSPLG